MEQLIRHKTNLYIQAEIVKKTGDNTKLLDTVYQRILIFYDHTNRHDNLCKTRVQGYVEGKKLEREVVRREDGQMT